MAIRRLAGPIRRPATTGKNLGDNPCKNSHPKRSAISIALLALGALAFNPAQATVTDADILNDAATKGDVVSFGLGTQGQRFSPMTQINTKTVKNLVPAWSMSFGGEKQRGQESQPVIHNGKMFVTASYSRLFAVDAKTGKKLWKYEHRLPDGIMPCCDVINRGAALHGDLVIFAPSTPSWWPSTRTPARWCGREARRLRRRLLRHRRPDRQGQADHRRLRW
jgi:glucose dehydrogenase